MAIKKLCPFKLWTLQNFPFIAEDFDALTNYELMCKIVEYLNNVINVTNDQTKAIGDIQTWFDNLDVQEEVNKKLDEMAESGELQELISAYLNSNALITFNTLNDMKNATNIISGTKLRTLGYYNINDGGGATYYAREVTNEDVENDIDIIALNDTNLVAEMIFSTDYFNVLCGGVKNDGETDNYSKLNEINDIAFNRKLNLFFPSGTYMLGDTLLFKNSIYGTGINTSILKATSNFTSDFLIDFYHTSGRNAQKEIKNIRLDGNNITGIIGSSYQGGGSYLTKFDKVGFYKSLYSKYAIDFQSSIAIAGALTGSLFNQCIFEGNGKTLNIGQNMDDVYFLGCRFGNTTTTEDNTAVYRLNGNVKFENCYFSIPKEITSYQGVKRLFEVGNGNNVIDKCFIEESSNNDIKYLFFLPSVHSHLDISDCNFNLSSENTSLTALIRVNVGSNLDHNIKIDGINFSNFNESQFSDIPLVEYYCSVSNPTYISNLLEVNRLNSFTLPTRIGTSTGSRLIGHLIGYWNNKNYDDEMYYSYWKYQNQITLYNATFTTPDHTQDFVINLPNTNTKYEIELALLVNGSLDYVYTNKYIVNVRSGGTNNKSTVIDCQEAYTNDSSVHRITNVTATISELAVSFNASVSGSAANRVWRAQVKQIYAAYNRI